MVRTDPALARLHLFAGCFLVAVGSFAEWNTCASFMCLSLGCVMFSLAALHALPGGPGWARTTACTMRIVFVLATVPLPVAAVLTGPR